MKKIMLVFDGNHFSEGAFEFARQLNELQPVFITGVFLPQAQMANLWSFADAIGSPIISLAGSSDSDVIREHIERFKNLCFSNHIEHNVHEDDHNFALSELKKESLYADIIILGSESFYENMGTGAPNDFLKDALHGVKCPVILVPEKFDFPKSIVLAYDGSEDSIFAIKQFAYLLPELTHLETLLIFAHDDDKKDFPEKVPLLELTSRHFSNLILHKLEVNPTKQFSNWIMENKTALLVSGSYGRSGFSRLFKKSFIKEVISSHRLPVFIAHQ